MSEFLDERVLLITLKHKDPEIEKNQKRFFKHYHFKGWPEQLDVKVAAQFSFHQLILKVAEFLEEQIEDLASGYYDDA